MLIPNGHGSSAALRPLAPIAAFSAASLSRRAAATATSFAAMRETWERVTDDLMSFSSGTVMSEHQDTNTQILTHILGKLGENTGQLATLFTLINSIQRDQTALASRLEGVESRLGKLENFQAAHIAADDEKRRFMERIETEGNAQRQSIARGLTTMQKSELKAKTTLGVLLTLAAILWSLIQMNGAAIRSAFKALLRGE